MPTTTTTAPRTAYRKNFRDRHSRKRSLSHNPLISGNESTRTASTIDTIQRCGDNVICDIDSTTGVVAMTYITPILDANVSMTVHGATNETYYYNQDERSSVVNLTDTTGVEAQSYGYSAYGDKVDALTEGSVEQRYTYTGRELSEASGDYYFRYRWYGAASGSFMSRDPLGYVDGSSVYPGWFAARATTDSLGLRLTPWDMDPKTQKFEINTKLPKGVAGRVHYDIDDYNIEVIETEMCDYTSLLGVRWKCNSCKVCTLSITGRARLKTASYNPFVKDSPPYLQKDLTGLGRNEQTPIGRLIITRGDGTRTTVEKHERTHLAIAKFGWNQLRSVLDVYDGQAVDCECQKHRVTQIRYMALAIIKDITRQGLELDVRDYRPGSDEVLIKKLLVESYKKSAKMWEKEAEKKRLDYTRCVNKRILQKLQK